MLIKEFLETNPNPIEPGYVFALLPEKTKDVYHGCVKKAAESLGLRCESFLDFNHPADALRDILARIQKAEVLVYDITDLTPNVMWELGVGLAIKDPQRVIVIRQKSDASLPFDIYNHRVSFEYDPNSEESLNELYKTLREVMLRIKRSHRKPHIESPEIESLLKGALSAIEKHEWVPAQALFETMDSREPNNWFIQTQWGIMLRRKGEISSANDKLNQALTFASSDDKKAIVLTELAVLYQMSRRYTDAEDWFRKAEKADAENLRLHIAWAEYHDELGDYFNAQVRINSALGKLKLEKDDPNYRELMLRHAYYDKKIQNPDYGKTFEQFKVAQRGSSKPASMPHRTKVDDRPKPRGGGHADAKASRTETRKRPRERFLEHNPSPVMPSEAVQTKPVLLGASAPRAVRPGDSFAVRFVAYVKKFEKAIEAQLKQLSPDSETYLRVRETRWRVGTQVKLRLSSPHLIVSSPEESFTWKGNNQTIDFGVQALPNISQVNTVLHFNVLIGDISVATFVLDISIDPQAIEERPVPVFKTPANTGFASYASQDYQRVLDRTEEIRRSGLDLWMDCLDLRPGEKWKREIEEQIKQRDLFLLFWSTNAKKSKWVRWEWKLRYHERGISGIDLHVLEPDDKPPRELKDLHFGSPQMLIRKALGEPSGKI